MIWKNARLYNEDGSDIYNLSVELEVRVQASSCPACVSDLNRNSSMPGSPRRSPRSKSHQR